MSGNRERRRLALRPTLDGLESKLLLSGVHANAHFRQGYAAAGGYKFQVGYGGQLVEIKPPGGGIFDVSILVAGTIRAKPLPNHGVDLIVDGTNSSSILTIDTRLPTPPKHGAHLFQAQAASPFLNVGQVDVTDGMINQILGYHDANLTGPIVVAGEEPVDRIAFTNILAGASISTGGDLNTLDVLNNITLSGGPGIQVGSPSGNIGDLNSLSVGGSVTLSGGSSFIINRDLGLTPQPAKGSGPAGQGGLINGNLTIDAGSVFRIGRRQDSQLIVNGTISEPGAANFTDRIIIGSVSPNIIAGVSSTNPNSIGGVVVTPFLPSVIAGGGLSNQ